MSDFITVAELRIEAERLCDENERLEAENAELRNDADLLRAMWSQERTEKRCHMAENAKLRKYVAWLEKWALDHAGFGMGAEVQFELDMARRELGIEVEE